jgi:hypothetical protein
VRDRESLRKIAHKSNMVMQLPEANKMLNLIEESERVIENKLSDTVLDDSLLKIENELRYAY